MWEFDKLINLTKVTWCCTLTARSRRFPCPVLQHSEIASMAKFTWIEIELRLVSWTYSSFDLSTKSHKTLINKIKSSKLYLILVSCLSNSLYFLQLKQNKIPLRRSAKPKDNRVMLVNGTCCSRTLVLSTTSTSMASSLANRYLLTPTIVSKEVTKTELWLLITRR